MGGSVSKSDSDSDSGFQQSVWGGQTSALKDLFGNAQNLFNTTNSQMQSMIPGAQQQQQQVFSDTNPYWQNQMQGGAYNGMNLQGRYNDALSGGGGNEQAINEMIMGGSGNNYVDAMQSQMQRLSDESRDSNLRSADARASGSGMMSSSGANQLQRDIYDDANQNLTDAQTNLGVSSFDTDLNRKLGIAQRADTYDMNRLNNISGMLGNQQNVMDSGLQNSQMMQNLGLGQFAPSNMPWQAAGQYANMIGRPTVLGSGNASSNSSGFGASGGVGGGKG